MKGKLLTSWSLVWLLSSVLLMAGGALNLYQRAFQKLPPTDGILWTQRVDGIYAAQVIRGLAGDRAGISVGDKLIGIGLEGDKTEEIAYIRELMKLQEAEKAPTATPPTSCRGAPTSRRAASRADSATTPPPTTPSSMACPRPSSSPSTGAT